LKSALEVRSKHLIPGVGSFVILHEKGKVSSSTAAKEKKINPYQETLQ